MTVLSTRYGIADNSPAAAAERNVPRNPRPLCREFVAQQSPAEYWCATCHWNRTMHDSEAHREAIAAELLDVLRRSSPATDQDWEEPRPAGHVCSSACTHTRPALDESDTAP